jgi:threonyl-tRNA synthetase
MPERSTSSTSAPTTPSIAGRDPSAIFGSFERFIAILIEHYAGAFPLWLAPVQAIVLPISDRHLDYAGRFATV